GRAEAVPRAGVHREGLDTGPRSVLRPVLVVGRGVAGLVGDVDRPVGPLPAAGHRAHPGVGAGDHVDGPGRVEAAQRRVVRVPPEHVRQAILAPGVGEHEAGGGEEGAGLHGLSRAVVLTESSASWAASTATGAPVIWSVPWLVLGKGITSRRLGAPVTSMESRSIPSAIPPCGGAPERSASRRKPNLFCASFSSMPRVAKTFFCTSGSWSRMDPPPSSKPLSTRS